MTRFGSSSVRMVAILGLALLSAAYTVAAQAAPVAGTAIVLQDQAALRGAARDSAPVQAQLWRGEALEIRGERLDFWQVYDYRRERGGYVRKTQLLRTGTTAADAADLLAALRVVRQTPGAEALGLGLVAAYVQAAPAELLASASGAEALDAMGSLAERLADRASASAAQGQVLSKSAEAALAGHLDVAARYGLRFITVERDGAAQVCYEGEALRKLLALPASSPEQRARAGLALTRPDCLNPLAAPRELERLNGWRAEVLDLVEVDTLPAHWKNHLLMRRAAVWSSLAFARVRRGDALAAAAASQRALTSFAGVQPAELAEDDAATYNDAAMRSNAQRWAALPPASPVPGLSLMTSPEGETCVAYQGARRCTWGLVWAASARLNREGNALALAVQPLDGWTELWVLRRSGKDGWTVDVMPPAPAAPNLGYVEFAGWVPGGQQLLVAREFRAEGRYRKSFEVLALQTLTTERQAGDAKLLGAFQRWQDAGWRQGSASLR